MKIIGITGGIGSGKSKVLSYLEETYKAPAYEADKVAHKLQEPGQTCYKKIVASFGEEVLKEGGDVDRKKLSEIVFADAQRRSVLNEIVHPAVKCYIRERIAEEKEKGSPIFFVEAALLIEDHYDEICDELWYIYAKEDVRKERLRTSRGYSEEKIDQIFTSQKSVDEFREKCDREFDNSGFFKDTCILLRKAVESIC